MTKRVLVTGGFGFIGSHLIESLLDSGHKVHVVDNLSNNPVPLDELLSEIGETLPEYKYKPVDMDPGEGIEILYEHDTNKSILTYDICSLADFCTVQRRRTDFDEIYHLASVVGPVGVLAHAGEMASRITADVSAIAKLAVDSNARLVDVSTSEVYGPVVGALAESQEKVIPTEVTVRLEYAVGKLAGEVSLLNMAKVADLDVRIVRPFNVAGPRQSDKGGFVIPRFVLQAMCNKPLTVYGDGTQVRAFTHVSDIISGLILVMKFGRSGEVYNIGNIKNKTSISELADIVIETTGSDSKKTFVDPKKIHGPLFAEAADKYPDARKAMNVLGWKPTIGLVQIVSDVHAHLRNTRLQELILQT